MKTQELFAQIEKGEILPLYYFYGSELWLIEEAVRRIKSKILNPRNEDFNLKVFEANRDSAEEILTNLQTFPLHSQRRLTIIREADPLGTTSHEVFVNYLINPNPQTCAIFIGEKADRRSKFIQNLEKKGALVGFYPLPNQELRKWAQERAKELGQQITNEALSLLLEWVGPDLKQLDQELAKLSLRAQGKVIAADDIWALSGDIKEENPFQLAQAVARLDSQKVFYLLRKNLHQGESPLFLLSLIVRQLRLIWKAKEMINEGYSRKDVESKLKILPFQSGEFWSQVNKNSLTRLPQTWTLWEQLDLALKTSRLDKGLLLEKGLWEFLNLGS